MDRVDWAESQEIQQCKNDSLVCFLCHNACSTSHELPQLQALSSGICESRDQRPEVSKLTSKSKAAANGPFSPFCANFLIPARYNLSDLASFFVGAQKITPYYEALETLSV